MSYKHNRIKEIWMNRPTVYIPAVIQFIKKYPFERGKGNIKIYIRNVFYLNWQCSLKPKEV